MTVGYIPTTSTDDSIINVSSDTPTKYMDYLFERQSGSWYLTGLTESETKAESTESTPARMCRNPWQKAMCRMPFLQQPVRILLRLRQTAPLQTRAWIHRRRNSPPTAPSTGGRKHSQPGGIIQNKNTGYKADASYPVFFI